MSERDERDALLLDARLWLSQMAKRYTYEGQTVNGPRALAVKDSDFRSATRLVERLVALCAPVDPPEPVSEASALREALEDSTCLLEALRAGDAWEQVHAQVLENRRALATPSTPEGET